VTPARASVSDAAACRARVPEGESAGGGLRETSRRAAISQALFAPVELLRIIAGDVTFLISHLSFLSGCTLDATFRIHCLRENYSIGSFAECLEISSDRSAFSKSFRSIADLIRQSRDSFTEGHSAADESYLMLRLRDRLILRA